MVGEMIGETGRRTEQDGDPVDQRRVAAEKREQLDAGGQAGNEMVEAGEGLVGLRLGRDGAAGSRAPEVRAARAPVPSAARGAGPHIQRRMVVDDARADRVKPRSVSRASGRLGRRGAGMRRPPGCRHRPPSRKRNRRAPARPGDGRAIVSAKGAADGKPMKVASAAKALARSPAGCGSGGPRPSAAGARPDAGSDRRG